MSSTESSGAPIANANSTNPCGLIRWKRTNRRLGSNVVSLASEAMKTSPPLSVASFMRWPGHERTGLTAFLTRTVPTCQENFENFLYICFFYESLVISPSPWALIIEIIYVWPDYGYDFSPYNEI